MGDVPGRVLRRELLAAGDERLVLDDEGQLGGRDGAGLDRASIARLDAGFPALPATSSSSTGSPMKYGVASPAYTLRRVRPKVSSCR